MSGAAPQGPLFAAAPRGRGAADRENRLRIEEDWLSLRSHVRILGGYAPHRVAHIIGHEQRTA